MVTGWPVTITVASIALDPCRVALPVEITHGRSAVGSQPDAPTLSFTWLGSTPPGVIGDPVTLGEQITWLPATYDSETVDYDDSAAVYDDDGTGLQVRTRFVGSIASLTANEADGFPASWQVECVGVQARLGFVPVTSARPQETDIARVQALAAAAGVPVRVLGSDTITLAALSIDGNALEVLHDVCESSAGLLWQSPDGTLTYGTAQHRALTTPLGLLPCEAIASGLVWAEAVESIVNEVTVKSSAGGSTTQRDAASIAKPWKLRHTDVDTDCASMSDLQALALVIIARRAWPYWGTPQALVYGHKLDAEGARLVSLLDVSTAVLAPFESAPGAVPSGPTPAMVEGWVETWDGLRHTVQVALSDTARWVATRDRTYTEIEALGTYTDLLAQGSYIDILVTSGA